MRYIAVLLFVFASPVFAVELIELDRVDSRTLTQQTTFNFIGSETRSEQGREFNYVTRSVGSVDQLVSLKCEEKYNLGFPQLLDSKCVVSIDPDISPSAGNSYQEIVKIVHRANVEAALDSSRIVETFENAHQCKADRRFVLFQSQQKKPVETSEGRVVMAPVLSVVCAGDGLKPVAVFVSIIP